MSNSILFLTDNSLRPDLADLCKRILVREAEGLPIISVSQGPCDLGHNVDVGPLGRSWMSLYKQILAGLAWVTTDDVAIAEHDVLYVREHLHWQPADADTFWYNANAWFVEGPGGNHPDLFGLYSYWPRRTAFSQLVCNVRLLRAATEEVMRLLEMGLRVDRGLHWYGEPGVMSEQFRKAFLHAESGRPVQLQRYLNDYITHYRHEFFRTEAPNLDIRWGWGEGKLGNFTGARRGTRRTYDLAPWGRFADVMATEEVAHG